MPRDPTSPTLGDAQRRADRIRAFQKELAQAVRDGAVDFTPDQLSRLSSYHELVLAQLARAFDVDLSAAQKRVSLGIRVATLIGALALGASAILFFLRIWGYLGTPAQVSIVTAAPLVSLGALELAHRRERLRFTTGVLAFVAFACFVLDLEVLGRIFAFVPTPEALLAYGVFAAALAYGYDQRLLVVAGALCLAGWVTASIVRLTGAWWSASLERPEAVVAGGLALLAWAQLPHRVRADFPPYLRAIGLLLALMPFFALGRAGELSFVGADAEAIELVYQVSAFVLAAAVIAWGIRQGRAETTAVGCLCFVLFLLTKLVDWWWDWMPRYLFFLVVGLTAISLLSVFRRVRASLGAA